jgi:hypothetical protein
LLLNSEDAVELVLNVPVEKQEDAENKWPEENEDDNGQTEDSLQAPEVEEREASATDTSVDQVSHWEVKTKAG